MALNPQMGKVVIPSGYEREQSKIDLKRKLAQIMMERGLTPQTDMRSWTQLLGQFAQAWAGKSLDKEASKMQADLGERQRGDYASALEAFNADVNSGMDPKDLLQKYRGNPLLETALKPYENAYSRRLTEAEEIVKNGGTWDKKGNIKPGDAVGFDPNDDIISVDGQLKVNDLKVAAKAAQAGLPTPVDQYTFSAPDPRARVTGALAGQTVPQAVIDTPTQAGQDYQLSGNINKSPDGKSFISPEDADTIQKALGPNGTAAYEAWRKKNNIFVGREINGKTYYQINGKWYDNPEGR